MSVSDLTYEDVELACGELAELIGCSRSEILNAAHEHAGSWHPHELAPHIAALDRELRADPSRVGLTAEALEAGYMSLSDHSPENRRQLAAKGWALPDGSYPVEDYTDAKNAAILIRSHHGDWEAAERLLRRRCDEEGWQCPLDDEVQAAAQYPAHDYTRDRLDTYLAKYPPESYYEHERRGAARGNGYVVGLTDETPDLVLELADQGDYVGAEVARICGDFGGKDGINLASPLGASPEDFGLSAGYGHAGPHEIDRLFRMANRLSGKGGNRSKPSGKTRLDRPGRGHIKTCLPDCRRDHNQPRRGSVMHPEVERLILRHEGLGMFGKPDPDRTAGNRTYRPGEMPPGGRRY